jgi:hypothetical protein
MSLNKPLKRTVRQLVDNSYSRNGNSRYIGHSDYAKAPEHYLRAFYILLNDFNSLLDYVEPADLNLTTYSYRIHELLLRTCIELEANFVAILSENGYQKDGNWNILDFKKVNKSHHLSSYEVLLPNWKGESNIRNPFQAWNEDLSLSWFKAYNKTKHDRFSEFEQANFKNLTDSICGLAVLLASQFLNNSFASTDTLLSLGGPSDGMDISIGGYFRIKLPQDWSEDEKYDFNWSNLQTKVSPIDTYEYQ